MAARLRGGLYEVTVLESRERRGLAGLAESVYDEILLLADQTQRIIQVQTLRGGGGTQL